MFKTDEAASRALSYFRDNKPHWSEQTPFEEERVHMLFAQPDRTVPSRLQGRLLGKLVQKIITHLETNKLEQYYQVVQNGGKVHVIVGRKTLDLFGARMVPGSSPLDFTIIQNADNLLHYNISEDVARTWIEEARASINLM